MSPDGTGNLGRGWRGGMSTGNSTDTSQAVIEADLVYARVEGMSLRLDPYRPSWASGLPTLLSSWRRLGGRR